MPNARQAAPQTQTRLAVIGAGSIGVRLAAGFLEHGARVAIHDPDTDRLEGCRREIASAMADLGSRSNRAFDPENLRTDAAIAGAVSDADLVIECAPEDLALKRGIFRDVGASAPAGAILASATSSIPASRIAAGLPCADRCLVAHPVNPPHIIRVIELVPAPFTASATAQRAREVFAEAGYHCVILGREVTGFAYNRLQGAVLREAYCLVRDGVLSASDIDLLVREALGFRWSVVGPFEAVDLNTRGGIEAHARKLGPAYARMGAERGQDDPWTDELVARVTAERRRDLPLEDWEERVAWRDRELAALAAWRRSRGGG